MADVWASIQGLVQKHVAPRPAGATEPHRYALDRAQRIVRTVDMLTPWVLQEAQISTLRADMVRVAALFACIPMAGPMRAARQSEDPGDAMELAADQLPSFLPPEEVEFVLSILREYRLRGTALLEAQLLADAISLEDVGLIGLWNQMRSFHTVGRTLDQVIRLWKTQHEYGYWETRLRDDFHFAVARRTAQHRLDSLNPVYAELTRQQLGEDIQ